MKPFNEIYARDLKKGFLGGTEFRRERADFCYLAAEMGIDENQTMNVGFGGLH